MALAEEGERFLQRGFYDPSIVPLSPDCRKAFRILAVLRSTSFARSSVDADDRLPVPVREKSGSGL